MLLGKRFSFLVSLCVVLCSFSSPIWCQRSTEVDVRPCFSEILQDKNVSYSNFTFKLAMLSVWNYETYDSLRSRGMLEAVIEDIPVGASYEQATVAVRKMFQKHSLSIDQSLVQASWNTRLDPAAKEIMLECIRRTSANRLGLTTDYRIVDEKRAILYLHWNWIDDTRLRVKTISIHNGTVDGNHPNSLLTAPSMASEAIVDLTRRNPDDDIDIVVETTPNVKPAIITIPKLPKNIRCETTHPEVDESGAPQTVTLGPFNTSEKRFETADLGNAHHNWTISQSITDIPNLQEDKDSVFTDVKCSLYGTIRGWMDLGCGPPGIPECTGIGMNTRTASCSGWWQNPGRLITMRVAWKRSKTTCSEVDWPKQELAKDVPSGNPAPRPAATKKPKSTSGHDSGVTKPSEPAEPSPPTPQ